MFLKSSKSPEAENSTPKNGQPLSIVDAGDAELLGKVLFKTVDWRQLINLAQLGYKQELKRNFSTFEVFGIAFSIIAVLPSIASTLSLSMPAGPVGMVWVGVPCAKNTSSTQADAQVIGMVCCLWIHHVCWCRDGMANM
jgi:hypothetical protein